MKYTPKIRVRHVQLMILKRVLAQWRRLVAFRKALDLLHQQCARYSTDALWWPSTRLPIPVFPFLRRFFCRNHDSCSAGTFSKPPRKSCLYGAYVRCYVGNEFVEKNISWYVLTCHRLQYYIFSLGSYVTIVPVIAMPLLFTVATAPFVAPVGAALIKKIKKNCPKLQCEVRCYRYEHAE